MVIVVSEETSQLSVALGGRLERDVTPERIREILVGVQPVPDLPLTPGPGRG